MTELQRYLAEEVAEDHADGILTRREAMRRLGLLGVTGAAATSMLAPFAPGAEASGGRGHQRSRKRSSRGGRDVEWAPVATEAITFPGPRGTLMGAWAPADRPRGEAGVTELKRRVRRKKVAATGFCFGGGMVWLLLTSGEKRLAAAAPFYGPFPEGGELRRSRTAVLGIYAGLDDRVNATREAARSAVEAARLEHQFVPFAGAGHAFFNDTGARFNPGAMAEAYRRAVDWFDRYVAGHGKGGHGTRG
jgi:carboxymethylenebutenolidase